MNTQTLPLLTNSRRSSRKEPKPIQAATRNRTSEQGGQNVPRSARNGAWEEVEFNLEAPSAREVLLVADFTEWDKAPIKMSRDAYGVWQVRVGVSEGRHLYKFLVDGNWQHDPEADERLPNAFGTFNNVKEVSGSSRTAGPRDLRY